MQNQIEQLKGQQDNKAVHFRPTGLARRLDVHKETVCRHLRSGALRGLKIGRFWRVALSEVERFEREAMMVK